MEENITALRTMHGIQQRLLIVPNPPLSAPSEPKGVVYTKRWVVELLLDLAGYTANTNLADAIAVEPAAGDGAFLSAIIERLIESCKRLGRHISQCQNAVIAYEINEASAARARALATGILLERGIDLSVAADLVQGWIHTGDYLLEGSGIPVDFVIGNPPYVRLENIPEGVILLYREIYGTMRGRADLYVAFFEAALRQLKDGGTCAFICADRWMRNQYGGALRDLVTAAYSVDVVLEMHNTDPFHEEVDAYPAITVIRRQVQGPAVVASAGPELEKLSSRRTARVLQSAALGNAVPMPAGLRTARVDTWFKGHSPWPCHSPEQLELLRYLEHRFSSLETNAKVGIGVATGNDRIFITKDAHLIESSRLLKLALAKDIREGTMRWSGHYLVDPWDCNGLVDLDEYPRMKAYFEKHVLALRRRHTAAKNLRSWYRTIDRVAHRLTNKPKLYIADIKDALDPVLDSGHTYPHHNLYFIQTDAWELEVLGGLLLSTVGQLFVRAYCVQMRGGYFRLQAQYLRRIRVPSPEGISEQQGQGLKQAFLARDRCHATRVALEVYGIDSQSMERALGH